MKIPGFQENQRVEVGSPVEAVGANTREAEAMGEFGRTIQSVGMDLSRLKREKQRNDDALLRQMFANEMERAAQDSLMNAERSDALSEDGGNFTNLFEQGTSSVYDKIAGLQSPRDRVIAKNAADDMQLRYRRKATERQFVLQNDYIFKSAEAELNKASDIVTNDPAQYDAVSARYSEYINTLGITKDNKKKILEEADKNFKAAAIQKYMEKGRFDDARQFVDKYFAGDISATERKALMEDIETNEREFLNDTWSKETHDRQRLEWKKEEARSSAMDTLFMQVTSQSPAIREQGLAQAKAFSRIGVIKENDYKALQTQDYEVLQKTSDQSHFNFAVRLSNKSRLKTFKDDVIEAVADKQLKPDDGRALIKEYEKQFGRNKSKDKTAYNESKQAGDRFMRNAFPEAFMESVDIAGSLRADRSAKFSKTERIAMDLRRQGVDPFKAAVKALQQVDPSNPMLREPGMISGKGGASPQASEKAVADRTKELKDYYSKNKDKMSPELKKKLADELKQLKQKKANIMNRKTIDDIINEESKKKGSK